MKHERPADIERTSMAIITQELADLGIELREETSLAAFTAGFRLALGIAGELEPYSFDDEEDDGDEE